MKTRSNWLDCLLVVAMLVAMILVGSYSYNQGIYAQAMEQEFTQLQDHNQRLVKRLDIQTAELADARAVAARVEEYPSKFAADMAEARNFLWMADMALQELDRVIQEEDQTADIDIIIRDIRDAISQANALLPDEETQEIARVISEQAELRGIDPLLLTAVAIQESDFIPNVRGKSGEYGLLQIMPSTGRWVAKKLGYTNWKPEDMFDVRMNVEFSAYYFWAVTEDMARRHNPKTELERIQLGLLGYNKGADGGSEWLADGNSVDKHLYVCEVLAIYDRLRGC